MTMRHDDEISDAELLEALKVFDTTGSGKLSVAEMAHVLCADNVGEPMRSDECAEIFTEAGLNRKEEIDYSRLVGLLLRNVQL